MCCVGVCSARPCLGRPPLVVFLGRQEPGTNEQIKSFVAARAPGVLIAPKSAVNGSESHPLFTVGKAAFPGDCGWNFACRCTFLQGGACTRPECMDCSCRASRHALMTHLTRFS